MPDTPPPSPLPCDCCGADMQARLDELIHVSGTLNDRECNHIHLCPQCAAGLSLPRIAVAPGRCEPIPSLADVSAKRAQYYRSLAVADSLSPSQIEEIAEQEGLPRIGYAELAADMHASVDTASERDQGVVALAALNAGRGTIELNGFAQVDSAQCAADMHSLFERYPWARSICEHDEGDEGLMLTAHERKALMLKFRASFNSWPWPSEKIAAGAIHPDEIAAGSMQEPKP